MFDPKRSEACKPLTILKFPCFLRQNPRLFFLIIFMVLAAAVSFSPVSNAAEVSTDSENPDFVSIDFEEVDIRVFIKFMSKLSGKNFVVDSGVKGKVTIISPTRISTRDAYKVFESVLDINGLSTVESGSIVKIVPSVKAKTDNLDTRMVTKSAGPDALMDKMVTRIIPLEYANALELKPLLTPLVPRGSVVLSYKNTNMVIVTATLSSIDRLLKIIDAIDIKSIGKKITVLPIRYADAKKMVQNLGSMFTAKVRQAKSKNVIDSSVSFVADERTNSVIILANEIETEQIKKLIELLDRKVPKGEERIRVYYLEHASAENIVQVLQAIPSNNGQKETGQKKAPLLSQKVSVTADKATNSLIIMADKEDYPVLEEVISKLDIPRAMVYIEVLIMEVNVTRGLNIGTEWRSGTGVDGDQAAVIGGFGGTGDSGFTNLVSAAAQLALPKGFSVGVLGKTLEIGGISFPSIQAIVQAFQSDKDVHILSNPQILTTENEEATITVGKNVPFQTKSAAESAAQTYNSYEYKDVGVSLKITPQISKDRLVRLNVYQEITKLDTVNQSSPDRPTTLKRQLETTIIVEDSHSVVIGGLIDDSLTRTENRTPCLGGIPGLGWAFKSVSEGEEKTNLYVFLTPRVVKNPLEAKVIYQEKNRKMGEVKKGEIELYRKLNKRKILSDD